MYYGSLAGLNKSLSLSVKLEAIEIEVAENNMIKDVKNLYNQGAIFKKELKANPKLKDKGTNFTHPFNCARGSFRNLFYPKSNTRSRIFR